MPYVNPKRPVSRHAAPQEQIMMAEIDAGGTEQSSENAENEANAEKSKAEAPRPRRRGFAAMDRDRVKEIASKGGKAAHAAGTAHQFSSDEARNAGRKGGMAPHVRRGGVRRRPSTTEGGQGPNQTDQTGDGGRQ
jgi:general stress protein YciG